MREDLLTVSASLLPASDWFYCTLHTACKKYGRALEIENEDYSLLVWESE